MNYLKNKTEVAVSSDGKYFAQGKIDTIAQVVEVNSGKIKPFLSESVGGNVGGILRVFGE